MPYRNSSAACHVRSPERRQCCPATPPRRDSRSAPVPDASRIARGTRRCRAARSDAGASVGRSSTRRWYRLRFARMSDHRPDRPGHARSRGPRTAGRRADATGRRLRAVRLRPGPRRHGRLLCGLRFRAGGLGEHDPRHRQERPAALRRVRRPRAEPTGRQPRPSAIGSARARRRSRRPSRRARSPGMEIGGRDGVRAAGTTAGLGRRARDAARAHRARRWIAVVEGARAAVDPARAARRRGRRGPGDRSAEPRRLDVRRPDAASRIVRARDRHSTPTPIRPGSERRPEPRIRTPTRRHPGRLVRPARSSTRARSSRPSAVRAWAASGSSSSCSRVHRPDAAQRGLALAGSRERACCCSWSSGCC